MFLTLGFVLGGGEGGGFVSYDLHYGPSRSYKVGAGRSGLLFSNVSI